MGDGEQSIYATKNVVVGTDRRAVRCCVLSARPAVAPYPFMKRYLITGASRGIGRAIAEKLSASDVVLLLHGRDTVALAEVCESAKTQCAQVVPLIHDLALPSGVSKLIAEVGSGSIDLLVNNAGITRDMTFKKMDKTNWDAVIKTNLDSVSPVA